MNKVTQGQKLEAEELEKRAAALAGPDLIPNDGSLDQPGGSEDNRQFVWKKTEVGGGGSEGPGGPEPPTYTEDLV